MLYYYYNCHYVVVYEGPAMIKAVLCQILSAFIHCDIIISALKTSKDNEIQCHIWKSVLLNERHLWEMWLKKKKLLKRRKHPSPWEGKWLLFSDLSSSLFCGSLTVFIYRPLTSGSKLAASRMIFLVTFLKTPLEQSADPQACGAQPGEQ